MTEQALKDAKLQALETENAQLQQTLRSFTGSMKAYDQTVKELMNANVILKGNLFLREDDVTRMGREYAMLSEQCADLQKKVNELEGIEKAA